jgi:hypothetical protein
MYVLRPLLLLGLCAAAGCTIQEDDPVGGFMTFAHSSMSCRYNENDTYTATLMFNAMNIAADKASTCRSR